METVIVERITIRFSYKKIFSLFKRGLVNTIIEITLHMPISTTGGHKQPKQISKQCLFFFSSFLQRGKKKNTAPFWMFQSE